MPYFVIPWEVFDCAALLSSTRLVVHWVRFLNLSDLLFSVAQRVSHPQMETVEL
jgi:cob(I)alamin adenosyltransferase